MLKRTVSGLECEVIGHDGLGPLGRDGNAVRIDGSGRDCRVPGVTERAPMSTWGAAPEVPFDDGSGEGVVPSVR
jgi:hypothetical protein